MGFRYLLTSFFLGSSMFFFLMLFCWSSGFTKTLFSFVISISWTLQWFQLFLKILARNNSTKNVVNKQVGKDLIRFVTIFFCPLWHSKIHSRHKNLRHSTWICLHSNESPQQQIPNSLLKLILRVCIRC